MGYLDLLGYAGGRGYRGLLQGTGGTVGYWGLGVIVGTGGYSGLLQVLGVLRGTWGTLGVLQVLWGTVGNYGVLQVPYNNPQYLTLPLNPSAPPSSPSTHSTLQGERIKFYLDSLDRRFEVEPIVIEGLNHAVNFGIEFFFVNRKCLSPVQRRK